MAEATPPAATSQAVLGVDRSCLQASGVFSDTLSTPLRGILPHADVAFSDMATIGGFPSTACVMHIRILQARPCRQSCRKLSKGKALQFGSTFLPVPCALAACGLSRSAAERIAGGAHRAQRQMVDGAVLMLPGRRVPVERADLPPQHIGWLLYPRQRQRQADIGAARGPGVAAYGTQRRVRLA